MELGRSKEKCTRKKCYKKVLHGRMHSSASRVNIKGLIYFSAITVAQLRFSNCPMASFGLLQVSCGRPAASCGF